MSGGTPVCVADAQQVAGAAHTDPAAEVLGPDRLDQSAGTEGAGPAPEHGDAQTHLRVPRVVRRKGVVRRQELAELDVEGRIGRHGPSRSLGCPRLRRCGDGHEHGERAAERRRSPSQTHQISAGT